MTANLDEISRVAHTNAYEWNSGPDELMPSDSFYSSKLNISVKLRSKETDKNKFPIKSIYTTFKKTVQDRPDHPAIAFKNNDTWNYFNYADYWRICNQASRSFIKIGLEPNSVVTILGFNSPQWFISCLGTIFAAGVSCGIYTTNSVEACEFIFNDTKSEICVVENKQQLDKILKCKVKFKKIIQYNGVIEDSMNGLILSWLEFIDFGRDLPDEFLEKRVKLIAPNKCASLIYTSGLLLLLLLSFFKNYFFN
jgi:long-chain-fatty-acid--CoA ligase ACSBG